MGFRDFLAEKTIYKPVDVYTIFNRIKPFIKCTSVNTKKQCINIPAAFDIETSSFYSNQLEKTAIMYEWTFGINGLVVIGRTWNEYLFFINTLAHLLETNSNKRLLVYVHNLSYEFQFLRKWFEWEKVFAIRERTPIYACTTNGIEYRCSYLLSGYSLAKLAENMPGYNIRKLVGNLDYTKIHHSGTPLTEEEIAYCVNDVKIVMAYVHSKIIEDGNIAKIPLTKTGYVRQYVRNACFYDEKQRKKSYKRLRYLELIGGLYLKPKEYAQLKRAFQGGFTHANPFFSGKVVENVTSFDFTSSYPAVMLSEKFPMSAAEFVEKKFTDENIEELEYILDRYCCIFDVEFKGLESKTYFESYISESRCWKKDTPIINNGRIVSADCIRTTITEQDYMIIKAMYSWDQITVINLRKYKRDYLPTDFVKSILKLYSDKTTLKNVEGKEAEYLRSKEMINSCYGMAVTDIVREEIVYSGDNWGTEAADIEAALKKYNSSKSRFLFYPWGVWVTAYARRNLFTGILEFNSDYIYSDTDSIKVRNAENHIEYIEKYNTVIRNKLVKAMEYHGINPKEIEPCTIKGVKKPLGVWDFDGIYSRFKTLGAKRYLVQYSDDKRNGGARGKISLTVAGLNKKACVPYLLEKYGEKGIFKAFNNRLDIPPDYTGKLTHTYIDIMRDGVVLDYLGTPQKYKELSAVHLEKAEYSLKLSEEYIRYIKKVEDMDQ